MACGSKGWRGRPTVRTASTSAREKEHENRKLVRERGIPVNPNLRRDLRTVRDELGIYMNPQKRFDPNTHYAIEELHPDADTDHVKRKYLDIPYATLSPLQKLDIYLPDEGEGPFPVIVSIHGGAFMGCDKAFLTSSIHT
jgi:acetyl esterase/lipase